MSATVTSFDVTMPQLGETVAEGTVSQWLKQVGDLLAEQEPLLEVATDKVDMEIGAPAAGRLSEILIPEGRTVPVGTLLARIGSTSAPPSAPTHPEAPMPARARSTPGGSASAERPKRHRHSPRMRRLAANLGVDLDTVRGTGRGGRLRDADVRDASSPTATPDAAPAAAARPPAAAVPAAAGAQPQVAVSSAVVELDVTGYAGDSSGPEPALIAAVASAALRALRRQERWRAVTDLAVNGRLIADATDLQPHALRRRVAEGGSPADSDAPKLCVYTSAAPGLLLQTVAPPASAVAALVIGAVRDAVVAERGPGGAATLRIRPTVSLTLSHYESVLPTADAAALLTDLVAGVQAARHPTSS